jgi:uncharacterized repeat protein (TIGR01451 family)
MKYHQSHNAPYRFVSAVMCAALIAFGLWSGEAKAQACNLALNGSFESPNIQTEPQRPGENTAFVNGYAVWRTTTYPLDGWQTVSGTVDMLRYYNNASNGLQSIDLWGTAAATIRQTFTGLTPGRQYTFSVDYSGLSATDSVGTVQLGNGVGTSPVTIATLQAAANAVSNGTAGIPNTPAYTVTWRTYQHTFTAVGTEATVQFVNRTAPATANTGLFIDNFSFAGVGPCEGDLSITKNDGATTYTPGLDLTYTIVVRNIGTTPVTGAQVSDVLPTGITSASWTCGSATGGGVCGAVSGTGAINTTANLPAGASVTYRLSMGVPSNYTGSLTNTATVTAPVGMTDTNTSNNQASDTNTMESPPVSTACSPRNVPAADSFTMAPLPITGTVTKTGTFPAGSWTTQGGNYQITWTFSQPVPAQWFQFFIGNVADGSVGSTFTVSLGAGSTATVGQLVVVSGLFTHNGSGVIRRGPANGTQVDGVFAFNSTGTIRSLTINAQAVPSGDFIINSLRVRPACMTVEKVSQGDTGSFAFNLTNTVQVDGTAVPSTTLTTTAAGTPVSSPEYYSHPGTATTLGEVVPAGWGITSAVCTDQNAGSTGNPTVISTFATPTLTIPAANVRPEADIVCRFDNGQLPTLNLTKTTSRTAGGPFGFTLGNTTLATPAPVSTPASGSPVAVDGDPGAGTAFRVSSLGADVTIDESSLPAGWVVDAAVCTDSGGALVGSLAGGRYTIPAASITVGQTFNCSFVNEPTVNLRIDKTAVPIAVRTGDDVTYTLTVNNDGPGPGDGAVVTDRAIPGVDCSTSTLTCGAASGGAVCPTSPTVSDLQGPGVVIPIVPVGGSVQLTLTCTVTATGL